ncbi:DUF1178 family protein [Pararhizobium sp.]|uniref:DUF1178 family protein n=1 Tax=Pararhizobium sp. TaxID=1977563 RepID=UPI002720D285|nr:DUF1178 family protein [Pararhizobium sp.]MDO9417905.1 DUF1178 family protein [Pararhizobium sp.]
MIRYTLSCKRGHEFEGWFASGEDFDRQAAKALVTCPVCGSGSIEKRLMTPSVSTARKKEATQSMVMSQAHSAAMGKLREMVNHIKENAEDVGDQFANEARKIHYGEAEARGIMGKATPEEAREMLDEGIEIAPLPILPDDMN